MPVLLALAIVVASLPVPSQTRNERQQTIQSLLHTELSAEGKDCRNASSTYDENVCLGKALERTRANFKVFYENVFALVGDDRLRDAQSQWELYLKKTCDAVGESFAGGSIRPSQEMRCEIQLTRSRMRDLDSIYLTLHLK